MKCSCHPFKIQPSEPLGRSGRKTIKAAQQNITGGRALEEGEAELFENMASVVEGAYSLKLRAKQNKRATNAYYRGLTGVIHSAVTQGKMGRGVVTDIAAKMMDTLSFQDRALLSEQHLSARAELLKDPAFDVVGRDINTPLDAVSLLERGMSEQDAARIAVQAEDVASLEAFVGGAILGNHKIAGHEDFLSHGRQSVNVAAAAMEARYGAEVGAAMFDRRNLSGASSIENPELTLTHRQTLLGIYDDQNHPLNPALVDLQMDPRVVAQMDLELAANPRDVRRIITEGMGRAGALNMQNMISAESIPRLLSGLQKIAGIVDTGESWTETEVKSLHRFMDILDPQNRDMVQRHLLKTGEDVQVGAQASRQDFLMAQWAIHHTGNTFITQYRRWRQGTLSDTEKLQMAELLATMDQTRDMVTRWRSEAGRTLNYARAEAGSPDLLSPGAVRRTDDLVIDAETMEGPEGYRQVFGPNPTDEKMPSVTSLAKDRGILDEPAGGQSALKPFGDDMEGFEKFLRDEVGPLLDSSASDDDALRKILAMNKVVQGPMGWDAVLKEWRYGAMLSSPRTLAINLVGSVATAYARPLEMMLGERFGLLGGDKAVVARAVNELTSLHQNFAQGWKYAKAAFSEGPKLKPGDRLEENMTKGAINTKANGPLQHLDDSPFAGMINWIGKAARAPGQAMQMTDEAVKQMQYRTTFMAETAQQYIEREGVTPDVAWARARDVLDQNVRDGQAYGPGTVYKQGMALAEKEGVPAHLHREFARDYVSRNFDETLGDISKRGIQVADQVTFQSPLRPGSIPRMISDASQKSFLLNLAVPFVRTPTNLLYASAQKLDVIGYARYMKASWKGETELLRTKALHNKMIQDMTSGDPALMAEAKGRLAFGVAAATTIGLAYGAGFITGGGPSDPKQRKAMMQTGWRPYAFRTLDGQYFSYERLDPYAGIFGFAADSFEYLQHNDNVDEDFMTTSVAAFASAMSRSLGNKTYLSGLTDLLASLGNDGESMPKALGGFAGSFVPTVAADVARAQDPHEREMRSWLDGFRKRVPTLWGGEVSREGMPVMRNMFGEPVSPSLNASHSVLGEDSAAGRWAGLFVPVAYSTVGDSKVDAELQMLGKGFSPPHSEKAGMDLRLIERDGQSAYDRWLELQGTVKLDGLTLREAVGELMKTERYQNWTTESTAVMESPRLGAIRAMISKFRAAAFNNVQREFPEVRQGLIQARQTRAKTLLGVNIDI